MYRKKMINSILSVVTALSVFACTPATAFSASDELLLFSAEATDNIDDVSTQEGFFGDGEGLEESGELFTDEEEAGWAAESTVSLKGSGTQEDPWQIASAADYQIVYDQVAQGESFAGQYLKQMTDITLSDDWKPIGVTKDGRTNIQSGRNLYAFSGCIDGDGNTIIIPEGGLPLLGYVQGAEVKNLNIYGTKIAGYGLVNNFEGVGLYGSAIVIDNVTLKSGSSTLKSGLLGANVTTNRYAGVSSGFVATVRNCVIETGVTIGYDKDQDFIGAIAGRMQGTVENCVSHATVYGKNYVGGIIGTRDNALGTCTVTNCSSDGLVQASGEHAGGIVGGGYGGSVVGDSSLPAGTEDSAPNAWRISVNSCISTATVKGADRVGGILGADSFVAQAWDPYTFKDNAFSGKVSVTSSGASYIGGVIGFYDSLNKWDDISGNTYSAACGTIKGIGAVRYVDTNCTSHETASSAVYFSTENTTDDCPQVKWCTWRKAHNRTDDPLGSDADKLVKMIGKHVHQWNKGVVIKKATYLKTGKKEFTCTSCGEKKVEKIPVIAHSHKYVWKTTSKATVFQPAKQKGTCSLCKKTTTRSYGKKLKATIKLNVSSIKLKKKQTTNKVKVKMANGDSIKSWKSSNTSIVTVNKKGVIKAKNKKGTAKITVTLKSGKKASFKVTVRS